MTRRRVDHHSPGPPTKSPHFRGSILGHDRQQKGTMRRQWGCRQLTCPRYPDSQVRPPFYSRSLTHLREVHSCAVVVTGHLLSPWQPHREGPGPTASPVPRVSPW